MTKWKPLARALVITAVVLVAVAYSALATTWVTWVPTQTSAGTNATFNYWGGVSFMYSTQSVTWITPPMNTLGSATFDQVQNYLGSSGASLWVVLSSQSTSSGYIYQGTVSSTSTVAEGSSSSTLSAYGYIAFVVVKVTNETCVQIYFTGGAQNEGSSTATFYMGYLFGNATWFVEAFQSASVSAGSWGPTTLAGPTTCVSPGYYIYVLTLYSTVNSIVLGAAHVTVGGSSTDLGTNYALNVSFASGDTIVLPWTTSASPCCS